MPKFTIAFMPIELREEVGRVADDLLGLADAITVGSISEDVCPWAGQVRVRVEIILESLGVKVFYVRSEDVREERTGDVDHRLRHYLQFCRQPLREVWECGAVLRRTGALPLGCPVFDYVKGFRLAARGLRRWLRGTAKTDTPANAPAKADAPAANAPVKTATAAEEAVWSDPMPKAEMARRFFKAKDVRSRKIEPFLKRWGIEHLSGNLYHVRLDLMTPDERKRMETRFE